MKSFDEDHSLELAEAINLIVLINFVCERADDPRDWFAMALLHNSLLIGIHEGNPVG